MNNFLRNGAVLPSGLLSNDKMSAMAAFNKTYRNSSIRCGVVVATYPIDDSSNINGLATEYDVTVIEQNEDRGATTQLYRNCIVADGFGGKADFFEKTLRALEKKTTKSNSINIKGQDGNVVLIECLDGMSDKAIIIGGFPHPDRPTTLVNDEPRLEGEYNGVNVKVENDGSTTLTFRGATNNSGTVISGQNSTIFSIAKDGSVSIITAVGSMFNLTKDGSIQAISSKGNTLFLNDTASEISINQKDGSVIGMSSTGVTVSDPSGKQILSLADTVQLTSGDALVEQSSSHTIDSGGVTIKGLGGASVKDMLGAGFSVKNGQVAIGGPEAELLSLFGQLLLTLNTFLTTLSSSAVNAGPFPVTPPLATATAPAIALITEIQVLLTLITGSL